MAFNKNIFINCPFDDEYNLLLRPLIFTVLYVDLEPQISTTKSSGDIRVQEIMTLMSKSKFSIHDISRNKALKKGDIARFNMPYEMGLDIGCQRFGSKQLQQKACLIFDSDPHTYDQSLSDISGQDIKSHKNDPQELITKLRDWLTVVLDERLPSRNRIWEFYTEFFNDMEEQLSSEGFSKDEIENVSTFEYIKLAKRWIRVRKESLSTSS